MFNLWDEQHRRLTSFCLNEMIESIESHFCRRLSVRGLEELHCGSKYCRSFRRCCNWSHRRRSWLLHDRMQHAIRCEAENCYSMVLCFFAWDRDLSCWHVSCFSYLRLVIGRPIFG